jgi:hypothetical protein
VCDCIARKVRSIGVTGQISDIDKVKVQNVLRLVWMTANSGNYIYICLILKQLYTCNYLYQDNKMVIKH